MHGRIVQSNNVFDEFIWRGMIGREENKDGTFINKPIDKFNHAIDSIRYCCIAKLKKFRVMKRNRSKPKSADVYA